MNKTLRFTIASLLMLVCGTLFAQEVTLDFTDNTQWKFPVGSANKATAEASFTSGDYTVKLAASTGYYYNSTDKCLYLGKKNSSLTLPAFSFPVGKIEVVGTSGASTAVVQNIFVDGEAVSTATTGAKNVTNAYEIAADKQAAGTIYSLTVTSAHNTQIKQILIYKSTGKQLASAGLTFGGVQKDTIDVEQGVTEFTAPVFAKVTTAPVTFASDNEEVATVSAEGVITLAGGKGSALITATSEANDDYAEGSASVLIHVFGYNTYKKATAIESGAKYLLVAQRDGATHYAYPVTKGYSYGYLNTGSVEGLADEIRIKDLYDDAFTFEGSDGVYSIQDCYGRYMSNDGQHNTFTVGDTKLTWDVEAQADGTFKLLYGDFYVQWGDGTYTSFGCYDTAKDGAVLPYLYKLDATPTAISGVKTATAKNGQRYNLAGQRVGSDYKGIVIMDGRKTVVR